MATTTEEQGQVSRDVFVGVSTLTPEALARSLILFHNALQTAPTQKSTEQQGSDKGAVGDEDKKDKEKEKLKDSKEQKGEDKKKGSGDDTASASAAEVETAFVKQSLALVDKKDYPALLNTLLDFQGFVFEKAREKDIEVCHTVIYCLLVKLEDTALSQTVISKLISFIASNPSDRPLLRIRLMESIYSMLDSSLRFDVLLTLLRYAEESNNADVVIGHFHKFETWVKNLGAAVEQERSLYLQLRSVLLRVNQHTQAHEYLMKYLLTFEDSASLLNQASEYAKQAAIEAIKQPEVIQSARLLKLSAIKQLENSTPLLYSLLKIYAHEGLDAFEAFQKAHADFFASLGLVYEECLKKMRMLSLASLVHREKQLQQHDVGEVEISYALIATTLSIDESAVEAWIIEAIMARLLNAKLDQLKRVVIVYGVAQREFESSQWNNISTQLAQWHESVAELVQVALASAGGSGASKKPLHGTDSKRSK